MERAEQVTSYRLINLLLIISKKFQKNTSPLRNRNLFPNQFRLGMEQQNKPRAWSLESTKIWTFKDIAKLLF